MRIIGSQIRETLGESGMKLVGRLPGCVILEDAEGKQELWFANNQAAGYVIQVGRWGYEFARDWKPPVKVPAVGDEVAFGLGSRGVVREIRPVARGWEYLIERNDWPELVGVRQWVHESKLLQ